MMFQKFEESLTDLTSRNTLRVIYFLTLLLVTNDCSVSPSIRGFRVRFFRRRFLEIPSFLSDVAALCDVM